MEKINRKAIWLFFFNNTIKHFAIIFISGLFTIQVAFLCLKDNKILYKFGFDDISNFAGIIFIFLFIIFIIFLVIAYVCAKLEYNNYKYELNNNEIRLERGIIWKKYVSIPYENIQNIDIYRGLIARMFDLSDLHIHTAGYSGQGRSGFGSEGRLPGLSRIEAENIRNKLTLRVKQSKNRR